MLQQNFHIVENAENDACEFSKRTQAQHDGEFFLSERSCFPTQDEPEPIPVLLQEPAVVVCHHGLSVTENELELAPPQPPTMTAQHQQGAAAAADEDVVLAGSGPARQTSLEVSAVFLPSASDTDATDDDVALVQQATALMTSVAACNQVISVNLPKVSYTFCQHLTP